MGLSTTTASPAEIPLSSPPSPTDAAVAYSATRCSATVSAETAQPAVSPAPLTTGAPPAAPTPTSRLPMTARVGTDSTWEPTANVWPATPPVRPAADSSTPTVSLAPRTLSSCQTPASVLQDSSDSLPAARLATPVA